MFLFQERINRNRCNTKAAHMWNQPLKWVIDFLLVHSSTCFSWKICVWREAERPQADRNLSPHGRRHHSDLSETSNKWFIEVPWTLSVTSWLEKIVLVNGLWIYVILTEGSTLFTAMERQDQVCSEVHTFTKTLCSPGLASPSSAQTLSEDVKENSKSSLAVFTFTVPKALQTRVKRTLKVYSN